MYKISDNEIDFIIDDIAKRGIVTEDVRDNIVDHVCCIIEGEMKNGEDFIKFYGNTIARFFRKELREIEDETRDLLTFKYYYAMRRTLKITGGITVVLFLLGTLFKFQHWPGAGIMLVLALGFFGLVFIPLNIVMKYRDESEATNRFIITFGFILGSIITLGFLFKIFHWPGANMMVVGSLGLFGFLFIPIYFITRYRKVETRFNSIVHTTFMVAGAGLVFALLNLRGSQNINESVASMDTFQSQNASNLEQSNATLYGQMPETNNESIIKIRTISAELNTKIEAIKTNLIAKSNGISNKVAATVTSAGLNNTRDAYVVEQHFANGTGELTYTSFKAAVLAYNENLRSLKNGESLLPVQLENLQMTKTVITVVLHELVDIQVHIRSNENSYLNLRKGMLAGI